MELLVQVGTFGGGILLSALTERYQIWCEAGMHAVRRDLELKRFHRRKMQQNGLGKARVAVARKLGSGCGFMLRDQIDYQELCRRGQLRQRAVLPVRGC